MSARTFEVNFDGLIGPTHNYAGLAVGNVAAIEHAGQVSHPKQAALQGLAKMKLLAELGVKQAILPPQPRPRLDVLKSLGFSGGNDGSVAAAIERASRDAPHLLAACYSASSMWTANAATVSPSVDTVDGRVHLTPANLTSQFHRSLEATATTAMLRRIFADTQHFVVHDPLPATPLFSDEGAANHTRLCAPTHAATQSPISSEPRPHGLHLFAFGRASGTSHASQPVRYPARQSLDASQAVARSHQLKREAIVVQQQPAAIDAGVFHNDVIAVGHENVLLYHEQAFVDSQNAMATITDRYAETIGQPLHTIEIATRDLSLSDAVRSYLFNSQLVTTATGDIALIYPIECDEVPAARAVIDRLIAGDNPITQAHVVDLRQSMHNGGGPACLRLRVVLTESELAALHQGVIWSPALHDQLVACIQQHYRADLAPSDLRDRSLADECRVAHDAVMGVLGLA